MVIKLGWHILTFLDMQWTCWKVETVGKFLARIFYFAERITVKSLSVGRSSDNIQEVFLYFESVWRWRLSKRFNWKSACCSILHSPFGLSQDENHSNKNFRSQPFLKLQIRERQKMPEKVLLVFASLCVVQEKKNNFWARRTRTCGLWAISA